MNSIFARRSIGWVIFGTIAVCLMMPSVASAAIIKIQTAQSCNYVGLDTSTSTVHGGVHCSDAANDPFSLSDVLDGTISLLVGNSQTPSWNLINDTGAALTSLTLSYSGALASGSYIDMQVSGTSIFVACSETTFNNVTYSDAHCGTSDKAPAPVALPLEMTWSGGTGLAINQIFNLGTASFAHAGADAGSITGTLSPVPEPESYAMLLAGLGLLGFTARRRKI